MSQFSVGGVAKIVNAHREFDKKWIGHFIQISANPSVDNANGVSGHVIGHMYEAVWFWFFDELEEVTDPGLIVAALLGD